jgi:RNA polymerase sigma factor for flagellar operon FliA
MITEHLPIVRFIARRIHERLPQHVLLEDLYSAGVLGLLDACLRFDPSQQVKFRSYAQFRIRGAILDSLRTLDWSPRRLRRKGRAVEQAIQALIGQLHRSPTDIEIAQKLNVPLAAYQQLLGELKGLEIGSLRSERSEDSDEDEMDLVPGGPEDDPLFRYLDGEMRERLTTAIDDLPERERLIMTLYYYEEVSMKEIGLIIGVVESRISQLHASALLHLRARLSASLPTQNREKTVTVKSATGQNGMKTEMRKQPTSRTTQDKTHSGASGGYEVTGWRCAKDTSWHLKVWRAGYPDEWIGYKVTAGIFALNSGVQAHKEAVLHVIGEWEADR